MEERSHRERERERLTHCSRLPYERVSKYLVFIQVANYLFLIQKVLHDVVKNWLEFSRSLDTPGRKWMLKTDVGASEERREKRE